MPPSESTSTAKPWFCEVISTLPRGQIHHRLVGAVVAELELVGLAAERQAQDLMAEADAEDRLLAEQLAHVSIAYGTAPGSPGPLERKMPSGFSASTSAAGVGAGTTFTRKPDATRWRRMLRLMP